MNPVKSSTTKYC